MVIVEPGQGAQASRQVRMLCSQCLLPDCQRERIQPFRFGVPALLVVEPRQGAQAVRVVRMLRSRAFFPECKLAPAEPFGFGVRVRVNCGDGRRKPSPHRSRLGRPVITAREVSRNDSSAWEP